MAKPNAKKENRWGDIKGGNAFLIPVALLRHPNFVRLSPYANKLVMDLARQFTGFNNGYLCASRSLMFDCGWNSASTLTLAIKELEHYKIILRSRQGGRNRPHLHALSWRRIDDKPGKPLDLYPTLKPGDEWEVEQPEFPRTTGARKAKGSTGSRQEAAR